MKLPKTKTMALTKIKPYYNNPRYISEQAVRAVKESIENYGFVQPLVVDAKNTIIAGHTRHRALEQLGRSTAEVYVVNLSEKQARAYRIADNKTGEMTQWDNSALIMELRELEDGILHSYFPEMDLELGQLKTAQREVSEEEMSQAQDDVEKIPERTFVHMTEVECPSCRADFEVKTSTLGVSWDDLHMLTAATDED